MMNGFMNRTEEQEFLQQEYSRERSSLVILYGRRRIGKTALLAEFIKDKNALYFLATEENETQNLKAFTELAADFCESELLRQATVTNWGVIFETILSQNPGEKPIIVIDEFQYLGKSNPAFPSIFQKIWDTALQDKSVMVILCGSQISLMESQTLNYGSPLYGRRTGQLMLKQIPFKHYREFFPKKSHRELIEYFAITGGVPKYIELFADSKDIYTAIEKNVLKKSSFLYDEPNFLLQKEVNEVGSYFSLLKTIAAGNHKLTKIATTLGIKQTGLTNYLKTLSALDIIEREIPITEEHPEKSKRGLYRIKDNFLAFWFQFIYPNLSYIESGHPELAMGKIRRNLTDNHVSYVYEAICREEMWHLSAAGTWDFPIGKAGRWWNNVSEIDIVATDNSGLNIIFGECKFWEGKVGANVLRELETKAALVDWQKGNRHDHYILFSASGFTDDLLQLCKERNDLTLHCH